MLILDDHSEFLPFFFQEPVYLIDEQPSTTTHLPLGSNNQQILVLVDDPQVEHLSVSNEDLLTKILSAVKLSLDDILLVNVAVAGTPQQLAVDPKYQTYLSFGMPPEPWQFCNFFKKYEVIKDESERAYLWADPLAEIAVDVEKKKALWLCLKSLFLTE